MNLLNSCEMRMIQLAIYDFELVVVRCLLNFAIKKMCVFFDFRSIILAFLLEMNPTEEVMLDRAWTLETLR